MARGKEEGEGKKEDGSRGKKEGQANSQRFEARTSIVSWPTDTFWENLHFRSSGDL